MAPELVSLKEKVRFGEDFEVDLRAYELRRSGRALKLERIPMELLLLLVEQRDNIVTRGQIVERIWGCGIALDTDNSINGAIRKIRQVLRDNPERPRFIQTITGKGYRFIASVIEPATGKALAFPPPQVPASEPEKDKRAYPRWPLLAGAAVILVAALLAYLEWSLSRVRPDPANGKRMLAVLPFENYTGDPGQEYFSDGLTDEMITQLGRLDPQRLGVIARTSVMRYKNGRQPLNQVGRELGVQYVLEGSVRRDSGTVRITAQLIQVRDQTHLWAQEYDRELKDLLVVQGEIAREIAGEIQLALGDHQKRAAAAHSSALSRESYQAYDLYLKGRYFWNKRTQQGFQQAVECFEQAIAKDPNYARGYAGLADSYGMMSAYDLAPPNELIPKARAAALKAVQVDDTLAEAHTSLAVIAQDYDWDWRTAEKEYRHAIELDPNYATAHHWYAVFLAFQGRFDEAFREMDRARELDPLSLIIAADNGVILYYSRQYDRAIERFRAVLDMEPGFARTLVVVEAYVQKGQFQDALAEIERWPRHGDLRWVWAEQAYLYGRSGQPAHARQALHELEQLNRGQRIVPFQMITSNLGLGNRDRAFAWLEKAYLEHSSALTALKADPIYDLLRSDSRFQDLLRRVGLSQ